MCICVCGLGQFMCSCNLDVRGIQIKDGSPGSKLAVMVSVDNVFWCGVD